MELGITGKLALVTGASRGIGRAIAVELAREGARLILVARNRDQLDAVSRELSGGIERHVCVDLDLMAADGPSRLTAHVLEKCGAPEIIVHNLGGSLGVQEPLGRASDWQRVWQFNLGISIDLNHAFLPPMIERRWGRIVHLSTLSTTTYKGYPAYVSAKSAVNAYVKTVSREVARHNVIVSAVAPGAIYIEGRYLARLSKEDPAAIDEWYRHNLPARRLGRTEEIAPFVAMLCSDAASFAAGSIVAVDGGGM